MFFKGLQDGNGVPWGYLEGLKNSRQVGDGRHRVEESNLGRVFNCVHFLVRDITSSPIGEGAGLADLIEFFDDDLEGTL